MRCDAVVELGVDTEMFYPDHDKRTPEVSIWTHTAWPEYPVKGMHIVQAAIEPLDVEVNLMAHMPRSKIAEGLKKAHIHIFPSCYQETFGLCLCDNQTIERVTVMKWHVQQSLGVNGQDRQNAERILDQGNVHEFLIGAIQLPLFQTDLDRHFPIRGRTYQDFVFRIADCVDRRI